MSDKVYLRFSYDKKAELDTARGKTFVVSRGQGKARYTLRVDEFDLASLFDGQRTREEVLDGFKKEKGKELTQQDLDDFLKRLAEAELLEEVVVSRPKRRSFAGRGQQGAAVAAAGGRPAQRPADDDLYDVADAGRNLALYDEGGKGGTELAVAGGGGGGVATVRPAVQRKRFHPLVKTLLVVGVLAVPASLPYQFEVGGEVVLLPVHSADVRALIEGDVREVFVEEGDMVQQGQLLARMASDEEAKNIAVAEDSLDKLRAELALARNGPRAEEVALARQKVQTAQTTYDFSFAQAERLDRLHQQGVVSIQDYEEAEGRAARDRELLAQAKSDLALVLAGSRPEEIAAIEAQIAEQQALLEYYHQRFQYSELRAPISGQIVSGSLLYSVGNYLEKGDLFARIEDTRTVFGEIRVPESDIGEVARGAPVRIKTWAYPDERFEGTVRNIAPNAEDGPYGKVVRVMTEVANSDGRLKSEMTGHAKIQADEVPAFIAFSRMIWRFIRIELWSWIP